MIKQKKYNPQYEQVTKKEGNYTKQQNKTTKSIKQRINEWMDKLQKYMLDPEGIKLCEYFDKDRSFTLDWTSFNKILVSTKIKDFQDENVRNIILDYVFFDKKRQKKGKINYYKLFNIKQKKLNKNEQHQSQTSEISFIDQLKQKQLYKENKQTKNSFFSKIKQISQSDQLMNKLLNQQNRSLNIIKEQIKGVNKQSENIQKNKKLQEKINIQVNNFSNIKTLKQYWNKFKNIIKVQQEQNYENDENLNNSRSINYKKKFPKSIRYYNLGIPSIQHIKYLQELQNLLVNNQKYIDKQNPKSKGKYKHASQIFQGEQYQVFQIASSVIHRQKDREGIAQSIEPKDIIQGQSGDCYFLSAIASLSFSHPQLIKHLFLFNSNKAHYYGVKIFFNGQWQVQITDDQFPCFGNIPIHAKPHGKQIWVMLLQKCWAKINRNYSKIQSGLTAQAFEALTGALTQYYSIRSQDINQYIIERKIVQAVAQQNRYAITAMILAVGKNDDQQFKKYQKQAKKLGLIINHSYSLLDIIYLNKNNLVLVKIRNPWGNQNTSWQGDWSFLSQKWTKQMRNNLNYNKNPQDGSFYMDIKDFFKYFAQIVICKVKPAFVNSTIKIACEEGKTRYIKMIIKESGNYSISTYQMKKKSLRQKKKYPNYKYSPTRIIIMRKISDQKLQYINSKLTNQQYSCSAQCYLQQGEYIISFKVIWQFSYPGLQNINLTSYGPQEVQFQQMTEQLSYVFKRELIESFAKQKRGKIRNYECVNIPQAYNEIVMDINLGLGYYMFFNPAKKPLQLKIEIKLPKVQNLCSECKEQIEKQILYQKYQCESQNSNQGKYYSQFQSGDQCSTKSQSRLRNINKSKGKKTQFQQIQQTGIYPILPQQLPLRCNLKGQQMHLIGFFINSTGFKYQYSQQILYENKIIRTSIIEQISLVKY